MNNTQDLSTMQNMIFEENRRVIQELNNISRPKNTKKNYEPKIKEFIDFCDEMNFLPEATKYTVTGDKLALFLTQKVINRLCKSGKNKGNPISDKVVKLYVAAVVDLYRDQVDQKINSHPSPRTKSVKVLLRSLKRRTHQKKREEYADRGVGTLQDGYTTMGELIRLMDYFMNDQSLSTAGGNLRNRLAQLNCNFMSLRGENARSMELPDLFQLTLENEGLGECRALIAVLDNGKTNQNGRIEFGACLRNKEVRVCPVGALALVFFWRFEIEKEPFIDTSEARNWYNIKLLKSRKGSREKEWSYRSQLEAITAALRAVGIVSSKKTHSGRGCSVRMAELLVVPNSDIRQQGRWNTDAMNGSYSSCLPRVAMWALAGFDGNLRNYFLKRGSVKPTAELSNRIFENLESELAFHLSPQNKEPNIAAIGFLKLLDWLREVLLQDSVELRQHYPDHPIWDHAIFQSEMYLNFEEDSRNAMENTQDPHLERLESHMSQLMQYLNSNFKTINDPLRDLSREVQTLNNTFKEYMDGEVTLVWKPRGTRAENRVENQISQAEPESDPDLSYKIPRGISTVRHLWEEWNENVLRIERKLGAKWRKGSEKVYYSRRKKIMDKLNSLASSTSSIDEAISMMTNFQGNKSIDWLSKNLETFNEMRH